MAWHLANAFDHAGNTIHQIISRNEENAKKLANKYAAFFDLNIQNIANDSDFVFLTVPDDKIVDILRKTEVTNPCFVHCAGSISLSEISNFKPDTAIFYPLQTFSKNRKLNYFEIPVFVEASNLKTLNKIRNLAENISNNVIELDSEKRKILHLAAVISNNFTNHLLLQAENLLSQSQMPLKWLKPLLRETIEKAFELGPDNSQTGPAVRNDENTIYMHLQMLKHEESLKEIYEIITRHIINHKFKK